jgi:fatty acid desaturase
VYACWWLGQLFVFPFVVRLRVMAEHGGVPDHVDRDPRRNTGTVLAGPLGRLLVGPNRVHFHVEHHLAAAVPSYRLPAMHQLLKARGYFDGTNCVAPSYWAVIRRCMAASTETAAAPVRHQARSTLHNMQ